MRDVLICDFGGVLTTPLLAGFLAYQDESGVSLEQLGRAMARSTEEHGENPLFLLERGEISEAEFAARVEAHLDDAFDMARLAALCFERLEPNDEMVAFVRELRGRGVRAAGVLLPRDQKPQDWAKTHIADGLKQPVYSI